MSDNEEEDDLINDSDDDWGDSQLSFSDGAKIDMTYCDVTHSFYINVSVPKGAYQAVGFGRSMVNTEVISWSAYQNGTYAFNTWYATGHHHPEPAERYASCYKTM